MRATPGTRVDESLKSSFMPFLLCERGQQNGVQTLVELMSSYNSPSLIKRDQQQGMIRYLGRLQTRMKRRPLYRVTLLKVPSPHDIQAKRSPHRAHIVYSITSWATCTERIGTYALAMEIHCAYLAVLDTRQQL